MTYRKLATLVEQLPPESRTKTAMRDASDPYELAELAGAGGGTGWGPWSHTDHLIAAVGERVDQLIVTLVRCHDGKPDPPAPWRRPGVLGQHELAEAVYEVAAPVINQLEAERAEREARRRAAAAAQQTQPGEVLAGE